MTSDLRVAIRPYARVVALAGTLVALWALLSFVALVSFASYLLPPGKDQNVWLGYALLPMGVVGTIVAGGSLWTRVRAAVVRRAYLRLDPEGIEIDHEGLLAERARIPRADIALAAIDARPARMQFFRKHQRFEIHEGADDRPGHLYSRQSGAPFPVLSLVPDVPNLLLVFNEPLVLERPRRYLKPLPTKSPIHPPLRGRRLRGLLVRVVDPEPARAVFTEWGILRRPDAGDVAAIAPEEDVSHLSRRRVFRDNFVLGGLVLGQMGLPLVLDRLA